MVKWINGFWAVFVFVCLGLIACSTIYGEEEQEEKTIKDMSLEELLEVPITYGYKESPVEVHVFMNTAMWNFQDQALGSYANTGSKYSGRPLFISYSGYVDIRCRIRKELTAEAEFELYKGETGSFKVCRLRQIWKPSPNFWVILGRDMPPIGIQDKWYYPPSQARLFALAPYTYWSILRATGWWDSGIKLYGKIPIFGITKDSYIHLDLAIINGPGDEHQGNPRSNDESYLVNHMHPDSASGYMWECFHDKARQPWDNNSSKHLCIRGSFEGIKDLEFGGSYATGQYDPENKYNADYLSAHLFYLPDRLTFVAEYMQLQVEVPPENLKEAYGITPDHSAYGDTKITQYSANFRIGYRLIKKKKDEFPYYLEPCVRVEYMDSWKEDDSNKGDRVPIWLGIRFSPYKMWTLRVGYCIQKEVGKDAPEIDNDGMVLESVMEF